MSPRGSSQSARRRSSSGKASVPKQASPAEGDASSSRSTRQRRSIENALRSASRPLAPSEILVDARREVRSMNLATVYRTIKKLVNDHTLRAVELPGEAPRYELAHLGHHHHFHCDACDKVFDIEGCPGDLSGLAPAGFAVNRHDIVLYGTCATCEGDPSAGLPTKSSKTPVGQKHDHSSHGAAPHAKRPARRQGRNRG